MRWERQGTLQEAEGPLWLVVGRRAEWPRVATHSFPRQPSVRPGAAQWIWSCVRPPVAVLVLGCMVWKCLTSAPQASNLVAGQPQLLIRSPHGRLAS